MTSLNPISKADENERQKAAGKGQGQGRAQPRKALGDIGNLVGPFNTRCNVGKENAAAKKGDAVAQQPKPAGVMTRRSAAAAGVVLDDKILGQWGKQKPRNSLKGRNSESAEVDDKDTVGSKNSLTGLLLSRSEDAATAAPRKAAVPESPIPDIDSADKSNPLAAADYASDIFAYYRRVEPFFRASPDYMKSQSDINEKMRAILIDWLVEVHLKFKLMPETLFLTTNLIDRFLAKQHVTRKNLQLVGVTAMLIASKYEEIWAPEVRDFVYISDRAYSKDQILAMEKLILNTLKFDLTVPTPNTFLCRFLKAAGRQDKHLAVHAAYLVELSLPDYGMLKFSYSEIAAAAVNVASRALGLSDPFPQSLQKHSGYKASAVRSCSGALERLQANAARASLVAVYKKYSSSKLREVSTKFGVQDEESE